MTMGFAYRPLKSRDDLTDTATQLISAHINSEIKKRDCASLFLSGGSTPGPIYENLSTVSLPWNKVDIGLVDERWVDENDTGSNAALVRNTLLKYQAKSARFEPMKSDHETAISGQKDIEESYGNIISINSLAVLGMGTDGHTASWFPEATGLKNALDIKNKNLVQAVMAKPSNVTGPYLERMTLTLSALLKCEKILLLITGDEKRKVLDNAIETLSPEFPISHLLKAASDRGSVEKLTILLAP